MVAHFRSIPEWDRRGFLPAFTGDPKQALSHPPYLVSLTDFVRRFGSTDRRRDILGGFLDYRAALHNAGLVSGFQWVNGSFIANTAQTGNREPNDIDVVTFYHLPDGSTQESLYAEFHPVFDNGAVLERYSTDTSAICLDSENMFYLLKVAAFWHTIWSHTKHGRRKGYVALSLSNDMDPAAGIILDEQIGTAGQQ